MQSSFEKIVNKALGNDIIPKCSDTVFVCHQHLLPSLYPLMYYICQYLCLPENVFLLGKPYSTIQTKLCHLKDLGLNIGKNNAHLVVGKYSDCIQSDIDQFWSKISKCKRVIECKKIIVLDEGGHLSCAVPGQLAHKTIAIEQTKFGARKNNIKVPAVQVSVCAAKRFFESKEIIEGVWRRLLKDGKLKKETTFGVIGLGYLGSYLVKKLIQNGHKVIAYDIREEAALELDVRRATTVQQLVDVGQIIIGCTGYDSVPSNIRVSGNVEFISISSSDIEFSSLLLKYEANRQEIHEPIKISTNSSKIVIANGGFPYNFDGKHEYEDESEIMLTRLLMMVGIMQALSCEISGNIKIPLDASFQMKLTEIWAKDISTVQHQLPSDVLWWKQNSLTL